MSFVIILLLVSAPVHCHLLNHYKTASEKVNLCSDNGSSHLVGFIKELSETDLKGETLTLLYDNYFGSHFKFQELLQKLLEVVLSPIRLGRIDTSLAVPKIKNGIIDPSGNEQMTYIVFSKDVGIGAISIMGHASRFRFKTILISASNIFSVKSFLEGRIASKAFARLLVVVDPMFSSQSKRSVGKECDVNLYSNLFSIDALGNSKSVVLGSWRNNSLTRPGTNLFPDKFRKGLGGLHIVVAATEIPPLVFRSFEEDSGEGYSFSVWDGIDVRLLRLLGQIMNFTVDFKVPGRDLSKDESVIRDVRNKKAEMGAGGVHMTPERYDELTFVTSQVEDCASFISLTSTALPKYRAIMGPFLWDVWLALTSVYLIAIIPLAFTVWLSLKPLIENPGEIENMFWYVFGTFTNCFTFKGKHSWTDGGTNATKLFIGSYWIFTIIITACYTGSIVAFITLPVYPAVIDSAKQLVQEKFTISTLDNGPWKTMVGEAKDPESIYLSKNQIFVPSLYDGLKNVTTSVKKDRKMAFLGSRLILEYTVKKNFTPEDDNKQRLFHLSSECYVPLLTGFPLRKGTLYADRMTLVLYRGLQAGYMQKLIRDVHWVVYRSASGRLLQGKTSGLKTVPEDRRLTLDDTQGMFLLLGAGFGIAFFTLAVEITIWVAKEIQGKDIGGPSLWEKTLMQMKNNMAGIRHCIFSPITTPRRHQPYTDNNAYLSDLFGELVTPIPFEYLELAKEKPMRINSFYL